jgi:enamine deaminase RidA (YjgF/YER057c/UK114 family)
VKVAIELAGHRQYPGVSQAVRVGTQLHVAGQVAIDEQGDLVGGNDPRLQAEQCFRNLEALLRAAGASPHDVVKLTCYLVDRAHLGAYSEAKAAFLGDAPVAPVGTAVVVAGLASAKFLMEVEALAELPT